jgi:5,10-methylenetetrahydromethanopterin reductase
VLRRLWTGEPVTWQGRRFRLEAAQLHLGEVRHIPVFLAVRGDRLLRVAGELADGVVLMAKSDLGDALTRVEEGRVGAVRPFTRVYLDRLAYTPEMIEEARALYAYALLDSPERLLRNLGLTDGEIGAIRTAVAEGGPAAATAHVTPEMVSAYQIAGTPEECRTALVELVERHRLDMFMMNVITPGLDDNVRLLAEVRDIITGGPR